MQKPIVPDSATVFEATRAVIERIYTSLKIAVPRAINHFSDQRPYNPYLYSMLVRYELGLLFRGESWQIHDEGDIIFEGQANIGLRIEIDGYVVRVRKTDGRNIPPAGDSETQKKFMSQQLEFPDLPADQRPLALLVLWEVDGDQNLTNTYLACPKSVKTKYGRVEPHWIISVPEEIQSRVQGPGVQESQPQTPDFPSTGKSKEQGSSG